MSVAKGTPIKYVVESGEWMFTGSVVSDWVTFFNYKALLKTSFSLTYWLTDWLIDWLTKVGECLSRFYKLFKPKRAGSEVSIKTRNPHLIKFSQVETFSQRTQPLLDLQLYSIQNQLHLHQQVAKLDGLIYNFYIIFFYSFSVMEWRVCTRLLPKASSNSSECSLSDPR